MSVVIETTLGDITVDLYISERPKICLNFLKLCKMKYYNLSLFHSIQTDFIAQTGDPTGKGTNGQSIFSFFMGENAKYFEADLRPQILHDRFGLLSMVNCGENMFGSQFFITLGSNLHSLDNKHCVFGEIVEGMEVLRKLNEAICDQNHRPFRDIRITHTIIIDDPFLNPPKLVFPDDSPVPTAEQLQTDRIAPDEEIDQEGENSMEAIERQRAKEARAQATILEMVGDIPHADVAPPENVLFVCKLNPLTKEEDLEIIFNRFGKINSCEVIKDELTGNSLQYAFIEFDDKKACEDAYFKMDNVLIDDRRIHVDFSQSVAKYKWRGKGRGVEYIDIPEKKNQDKNKDSRDLKKCDDQRNSKKYNQKERQSSEERRNSKIYSEDHRNSRKYNFEVNQSGRKHDSDDYRNSKKYNSENDRSSRKYNSEDQRNSRRNNYEKDRCSRKYNSDDHLNSKKYDSESHRNSNKYDSDRNYKKSHKHETKKCKKRSRSRSKSRSESKKKKSYH